MPMYTKKYAFLLLRLWCKIALLNIEITTSSYAKENGVLLDLVRYRKYAKVRATNNHYYFLNYAFLCRTPLNWFSLFRKYLEKVCHSISFYAESHSSIEQLSTEITMLIYIYAIVRKNRFFLKYVFLCQSTIPIF